MIRVSVQTSEAFARKVRFLVSGPRWYPNAARLSMATSEVLRAWSERLLIQEDRCIAPIILIFIILGVTYSLVNPIFEAPDELYHFAYVRHLATGHGLPVQRPDNPGPWRQEGSQPPLYYLLGALTTFWIDTGDAADCMRTNPHAAMGYPESDGNKNIVLHGTCERFPYRGTALAVHLLRLLSVCLGATTVAVVYLIGREVFPNDLVVSTTAAGLIAFDPQFLFISSAVSNDSLVTALSGVTALLALKLSRHGAEHRQAIGAGIALGLALLTKLSALSLLVVVAAALSLSARRRRSWPFIWRTGAVVLALAAGIAGWWYLRNWQLYGDPTGLNAMVEVVRPRTLPWQGLLGEIKGIELSFWAVFGWFNILADGVVYGFVEMLLRLSLLGLALGVIRRRWTGPVVLDLAVLALWLEVMVASLFRWTSMTMGSQGRLLFPAVPAIGLFLALGLLELSPQRYRMVITAGVVGMLLIVAVIAPFRYIAPAYARPLILSHLDEAKVPERVHIRYGEPGSLAGEKVSLANGETGSGTTPIVELIGYELASRSVVPGGSLDITLYWRALAPMTPTMPTSASSASSAAYSVYIHLRLPDGTLLGQRDSYPGRGSYPTFLWQPGQVIVDPYRVPVTESARGPAVGRIEVGLYTYEDLRKLPAFDGQGNAITPVIGRFKVRGPQVPEVTVANTLDVTFGDQVALVGWQADSLMVRPGETLTFLLVWRALRSMDADYTVFVHLVDTPGQPALAQADGQPQGDRYPTSLWDPGEMVPDARSLAIPSDLPPGEYQLVVGLYQLATGERLPRADGGDSVEVFTVRVVLP